MKIRNCSCRGTASIPEEVYEYEDLRFVKCHDCDKRTYGYWNGNHAIQAWNSIIKRELDELKLKIKSYN